MRTASLPPTKRNLGGEQVSSLGLRGLLGVGASGERQALGAQQGLGEDGGPRAGQ